MAGIFSGKVSVARGPSVVGAYSTIYDGVETWSSASAGEVEVVSIWIVVSIAVGEGIVEPDRRHCCVGLDVCSGVSGACSVFSRFGRFFWTVVCVFVGL